MSSEDNDLWKETYSVLNDEIDEEHRKLLSILSRMRDLVNGSEDHYSMNTLLFEMAEYAIKHFRTEEEYMEDIGYPKLDEHRTLHRKYSNQVLEFTSNHSKLKKREILDFLQRWWIDHITTVDQDYAKFSRSMSDD